MVVDGDRRHSRGCRAREAEIPQTGMVRRVAADDDGRERDVHEVQDRALDGLEVERKVEDVAV